MHNNGLVIEDKCDRDKWTPGSPKNSRATLQSLDQRSKMEEVEVVSLRLHPSKGVG